MWKKIVYKLNPLSTQQPQSIATTASMKTKEQLQQQLLADIGSDEIPIVKTTEISALSLQQLQELMLENNLAVAGSRQDMENALIKSLGSDQVDIVEMVAIDSLNVVQLEELLSGISRPPQENVETEPEVEAAAEELTTSATRKTIKEAQQELAKNCGFQDKIIWDLLGPNDAGVMEEKIKQLIPDQEKGQKTIEHLRQTIFENVWAQRKYTNRSSISYIFYVMVTKDKNFNTAPDSTEFSCHPVFRCKKCDNNSDSSKCCMIYVDETGRVYQNWKSFIEENVLPAGTMIAPRNGIYNFDKNDDVILDIYCTPNGTSGAKLMNIAQSGSAVVGIGAACVPLAALALPVAAPVVAVAGIIGLGVGAFTSITSALHLSDRKKHEQSISITDRQARGSYLGLVGGAVGVAAAGATTAMTSMAAAGKATAGLEVLVNGINITSIVLSGSGVANGVLDLIFKHTDGDKITSLDVLQLSASLVLFTHSLYNFQLASQIANDARVKSIQSYRETLSNRQRKIFDKMTKETVRIHGNTQGKMDVIRGVSEIPDRQYLNDLFKINKQLNKKSVRPAFGESGKGIVLNNELPVETGVLRQSVQHQQGPNILEQVTQPIPSTHNSDTYTTQTPKMARLLYSTGSVEKNIDMNQDPLNPRLTSQNDAIISIMRNLAVALPNGVVILLQQYGNRFMANIADGYKFQDVILSMADNLPEEILRYLIKLAQEFIEDFLDDIHRVLKLFIPTESVLYRILKHVLENYRNLTYGYISTKGPEIIEAIKKYYLSLNPNNPYELSKQCLDCKGMLYKKSVRPAFGESGKGIVLNNELPVETGVLRQSVQHQQGPNILEQVTQPIPSTHNSDTYTTQTPKMARLLYSTGSVEKNIDMNQDPLNPRLTSQNDAIISIMRNLAVALPNGVVILLQQYGNRFMANIADGYKFQDVILSMADNLPEEILRYLIKLAQEFIEDFLDDIHRVLKLFIPTESVLYRILKHVLENYRNLTYGYISTKGPEIIEAIKKYYLSLNPNNPYELSKQCLDCKGMLYICEL